MSPTPPRTPDPVEIAAGALQLLPLAATDAPELLPLLNDAEVKRWAAVGTPSSLADVQIWVDRRLAEIEAGQTMAWTVRTAVGGHLAGVANIHHIDHELGLGEIGFFVSPDHRRQGVARTSLDVISRYAFAAVGLHRLVLIHAIQNTASCRVAESCGYPHEGTTRGSYVLQGQRVDEHLHARLATDPPPTPRSG